MRYLIENNILKRYIVDSEEDVDCPVAIIPNGVELIGGNMTDDDRKKCEEYSDDDPLFYQAFRNNKMIRFVYIPDSVKTIGAKSFEHCSNINRVRFPRSLEGVSEFADKDILDAFYGGSVEEFKHNKNNQWCKNCRVIHCSDGDVAGDQL